MPAIEVAHGVAFAGVALTVGAVLFTALVWAPALRRAAAADPPGSAPADLSAVDDAFMAPAARLLLGASLAGLAASLLILTLDDLPGTRGPLAWSAGGAAFAVLGLLALNASRAAVPASHGAVLAVAGAAAAVLVLVPGVSGNVAGEDPAFVLVAANAAHVGAASIWAGGIACLLLAVPAGIASLPGPARSAQLVAVVAGFSAVALIAVVTLALTGVIQGLVFVGRIDALVTTGYGRLVLIKGALLSVLALAGAVHRGRTLPALRAAATAGDQPGLAAAALRRLLWSEAALLVAVFAATAALAATPPASGDDGDRSVQASGRLGELDVRITARPGRPGSNDLVIALSGPSGPGPAKLLVSARQSRLGIGSFPLTAKRTGPGRFRVDDASLPAPGSWEITLRAPGEPAARLSLRLR